MNEDNRELERVLERATASTTAPECDMDPNTAALREAWRVWGRLLQSAETPMDPAVARHTAPRSVRPWWLAAAGGVLAATVAIGAATAWIANAARHSDQVSSFPATAAPADAKTPLVAARRPATAGTSSESQWDDLFDDQLARVGREMIHVQQDWSLRAGAFDLVRSRLEEIHAEIESGQL
jgi:hypothetical protein